MSAESTTTTTRKKRQRTIVEEAKEMVLSVIDKLNGPKEMACDLNEGSLTADGKVIGMLCFIGPGQLDSYVDSLDHRLTKSEKIQAYQFIIQYYEMQIEHFKQKCDELKKD